MPDRSALTLIQRAAAAVVPQRGIPGVVSRLRFYASALSCRRALRPLAETPSPALQRMARERPEVLVGPLLWPYLCAAWDAPERLGQIRDHYLIVDRLGVPFPFGADEKLVLAELDDTYSGLRIVLDQPKWFMREGGLTLNLFVGDFRAYSLAFSFAHDPEVGLDCLIGSLQGRNSDEAMVLYRDLTKAAHGLRPRDLLLEICRILCRHWQVTGLFGVRDDQRHHRHPFFKGKKIAPQDYDAIWIDRGGQPEGEHFFRLPIASERRPDEEIKPNKRSLYRRRYRFLDELAGRIPAALPGLVPVRFKDL